MSSKRQSKNTTRYSFANTAAGLAILIVPLASAWYFLRSLSGPVEDGRALNDSSTDDENLAYGSDANSNNSHDPDERPPIIPAISLNPPNPPSNISQHQKPLRPEVDDLSFAASCAAGLSAAGFDGHGRIHIASQSGHGHEEELINAGTMQLKGIRDVRGDMGDYMSRD